MICFRCFFTCALDWKNVFREIFFVYHDCISIVGMYLKITNEHSNIYCTYICLHLMCICVSSSGSYHAQSSPSSIIFVANRILRMLSQNQTSKDATFAHKASQRMFVGRNLETFNMKFCCNNFTIMMNVRMQTQPQGMKSISILHNITYQIDFKLHAYKISDITSGNNIPSFINNHLKSFVPHSSKKYLHRHCVVTDMFLQLNFNNIWSFNRDP